MDGTDDLDAILDDLFQRHTLQPIQPGEFTPGMFAARYGMTTAQASGAIARAVKAGDVVPVLDAAGRLVKRDIGNGHGAQVYRKA